MPVSLHLYAAFVLASFIIIVIPGPTAIMVVSQALRHGRRVAIFSVMGVCLGDIVSTTLSLAGAGALLATSASLFQAVKFAGAAYLIWIGFKMWTTPVDMPDISNETVSTKTGSWPVFRDSFLVTALNPKSILFFVAFVPQFIDPSRPYLPQAALYAVTFIVIGSSNATAFALAASSARSAIRKPRALKTVVRTGGALLMMAGMASALVRRSA